MQNPDWIRRMIAYMTSAPLHRADEAMFRAADLARTGEQLQIAAAFAVQHGDREAATALAATAELLFESARGYMRATAVQGTPMQMLQVTGQPARPLAPFPAPPTSAQQPDWGSFAFSKMPSQPAAYPQGPQERSMPPHAPQPIPFRQPAAPTTQFGVAGMQRFGERGDLAVDPSMGELPQPQQHFPPAGVNGQLPPNAELVLDDQPPAGAYIDPRSGRAITPSASVRPPTPLPPQADQALQQSLHSQGCVDVATARVMITQLMHDQPGMTVGGAVEHFRQTYPDQFRQQ